MNDKILNSELIVLEVSELQISLQTDKKTIMTPEMSTKLKDSVYIFRVV